jgi:hypothetical protein
MPKSLTALVSGLSDAVLKSGGHMKDMTGAAMYQYLEIVNLADQAIISGP